MTDIPASNPRRPPKRKLMVPFSNHAKKLRCGPNAFLVIGNRHDPLNLEADDEQLAQTHEGANADRDQNISPTKLKNKKKQKHSPEEDNLFTPVFVSQRRFSIVQQRLKHQHSYHSNIQQSGAKDVVPCQKEDSLREKTVKNNLRYRFGNFNRYYGTRPQMAIPDLRLNYLCQSMFTNMNVLDIGCNSGLLTISIAKEFSPAKIVGIDLDSHLIQAAKQNIRYFCDKDLKFLHRFPESFPRSFGPISAPVVGNSSEFPLNLEFICENYVPEKDEDLACIEPEFDVILLFATTKWIHLNFGDVGIRRTFKKIFAQLKPKGKLLLEPLNFNSYKRSANSCSILKRNYDQIQFKPEHFRDYLLSEVGFKHCEDVGIALAGFSGPLLILFKESIIGPNL